MTAADPLDPDGSPVQDGEVAVQPPISELPLRISAVLWPSFLMAGVIEMLVFSLVDPADLHWLGGAAVEASAQTVYSVAFLVFWGVIALASALTELVLVEPDTLNRSYRNHP